MKIKYFLALALSAALVGCDTNSLEDSAIASGSTTEITVGVGFGTEETRMSVTPDANNEVWAVEWEQDDQVAGWFSDGSASAFSMASLDSDANYAKFTGEVPATAETMRFVYPCDVNAVGSDGSLAIDLSAQTVDMSDPYMYYGDNNMYMLSDAFAVSSSAVTHPTMHHLMAGMEMKITPSNVSSGSYVPTKAVITGLNSSATVAFADGSVTGTAGTITLTINNASALVDGQSVLLPFSIVPFTTTGSESVSVELYFTDGTTMTVTKSGIASGLEFKAGEHSTMEVAFEIADTTTPTIEFVVGDIYDDGTDRGVIWWVADDGKSCKITNISSSDDSKVMFVTNTAYVADVDAYDADNGYVNTQAFLTSANYSADNFPIIAWVTDMGDGWYLPAKNEFITMLPLYYSNSTFKAAVNSETGFIEDDFYWASTLSSTATKCWAIKYWSTSGYTHAEWGIVKARYARAAKLITVE